jgi:hypothetical protein
MEKLPTLLTAFLPVIGILIGASLQYFLSKSSDRRKQLEILKNQAYVDYLRSVAQIALLGRSNSNKRDELLAALADAKARICVYGSAKVIEALASFERGGAVLDSHDSIEKFLTLCNEMRLQAVGESEIVQAENLSSVLFGTQWLDK